MMSEEEDFSAAGLSDLEQELSAAPKPLIAQPLPLLGDHLKTDTEWCSLGLSKPILKAVEDLGFKNPTPIQRDAIRAALTGADVLGTAETGSGKTLAFLLPVLERLLHSPTIKRRRINASTGEIKGAANGAATKVLLLLPTRELAEQAFRTLEALCKYAPITRCLLRGAASRKDQEAEMRRQPDIVVATPGRCLDLLLNSSSVHLDLLDIVVFDEADRLVELGFKQECMAILRQCSKNRQTLFFSATLSSQAEELTKLALRKPVKVPKDGVDPTNDSKAARNVKQTFIAVNDEEERIAAVLRCLELQTKDEWDRRIVVFFNTKKAAHKFALTTRLMDIRLPPIAELHGNLSSEQRARAVAEFESRRTNILIATDVAARGLDLENVELVLNAEPPNEYTKYVHRVGRTGRKGQEGTSLTIFLQQEERSVAKELFKKSSGKGAEFRAERLEKETLREMKARVQEAASRVKEELKLESAERDVRLAEQSVGKAENLAKHKVEIESRPPKRWLTKDSEPQGARMPKKRTKKL